METSLNLLLPTLKSAGGSGIPHWDTKKGPRPMKIVKKKKKKKKKKKGLFSRFFRSSDNQKKDETDIEVDVSGITTGTGGQVQYLTRDEVYILRLTHDFLLEQFSKHRTCIRFYFALDLIVFNCTRLVSDLQRLLCNLLQVADTHYSLLLFSLLLLFLNRCWRCRFWIKTRIS
jgi:hypothetical protein